MRFLLFLVVFLVCGFLPANLVKTKITDGITVSLPAEFFPMTPDDIAQRLPSVRAPLGAYTNMDRVVDFSANISATQWPDGDIEVAREFFKAGLMNLYDRVDMIEEGIHILKKKKFIYFEFESYIKGNKGKLGDEEPVMKYTCIQYLVQPRRTLVFTFSCPKNIREEWQETAKAVMNSVRVR